MNNTLRPLSSQSKKTFQEAAYNNMRYILCLFGAVIFFVLMPVVIKAQSTKTFTVNMISDESDPNAGEIGDDGACDVDPLTPGDQCTFRAAVQNQNGNRNVGQNTINFEITNAPGSGSIIIKIGSSGLGPLPPILGSVFILAKNFDGRRIELDGSAAGANARGLQLLGDNCDISFFVINNFSSHGIFISGTPPPGGGNHRIESNYIGTDSTGTVAKGNGGDGIFIDNTPANKIGGTGIARNIISGNEGYGINIKGLSPNDFGTNGAQNNLAQGNLIGLDISGENPLPNKKGAVILNDAPNNTIGGTGANSGNKMAGDSTTNGVTITGSLTEGIKILGNFIGENKKGFKFAVGIFSSAAKPITIEGNYITDIAGVGIDLFIVGDGGYNIRKNSFAGNMKIGSKLRFGEGKNVQIMYENNFHTGNGLAIDAQESITGKIDWIVAGDTLKLGQAGANFIFHAAGNKNFTNGVYDANTGVAFNYVVDMAQSVQMAIKVNGDAYTKNGGEGRKGKITLKGGAEFSYAMIGSSAVNNGKDGDRVDLFADASVIATLTSSQNNLSVNGGIGVRWISDGKNFITVRGFIEKDIIDKNVTAGVEVTSFFTGKSITGNTITNNGGPGILIDGTSIAHVEGNTISGNGTGVLVNDAAVASINSNTITANGKGIALAGTSTGNVFTSNAIFKNTGLGIDLGNNGPTANDAGDADTGPNNLQNYPVLTAVNSAGGNTTITGTLNSTSNTTFRLDFFANDACNPSGFGEGQTFLDSFKVTTNANGNASFTATLTGITVPAGAAVTATATDANNNTSEFSACFKPGNIQLADLALTKKADKTQYTVGDQVTYTITLGNKGPAIATGIVVTDIVPTGVTFSQATASAGTYNNTTGKWSISSLNNGSQATLTIKGIITQSGTIINTAEVTASNQPDPNSSDNKNSVTVTAQQPVVDIVSEIKQLMGQVNALVAKGQLSFLQGRILNGFLQAALNFYNTGQIRFSVNTLRIFIAIVRIFESNTPFFKHLSKEEGDALIAAAQKIIDQLREARNPSGRLITMNADSYLDKLQKENISDADNIRLNGVYPNPFSSYINISFELVKQDRVLMTIYDESGRTVTNLINKQMPAGKHTVVWQPMNQPSGIYILRLTTGKTVKTYKMVRIR